MTDSAAKPADLLSKAFYPEVVRMDLKTKKPWNLMLRGTAMAAFASILSVLIILVVGKPLISLLFGKEFIGAYPIILVLIIAPLLAIISFPLPSMLYALDRPDAPLTARLIGTILFFVTVAPLSWSFGVIGAALAFVIGNAATVIVLVFQLFREYRRVRA
ncbi:polysaccharide biosynthesis C-terminal domain-containing protein [Sphingomonas daechungensis]|uniref:Polysaccharide biosynthesis C-terminal domain-containing protein n=1 Tax=Sphingomonas daechungensis TaxID=1176646 RepID=A0ABX6T1W6_9SPHN|nr:polysaccharide biosynthesis C-terminal domain-containing protein [Sphingomonas daechungensis]QNP42728.1 polysaccharide biosynthesis C-terminal domain-containing protein [Sphingomonas daechungensis]